MDGGDTPGDGGARREFARRLSRVEELLLEVVHEVDDLKRAVGDPAGERTMEPAQGDSFGLSRRKREILALLAEGQSNKEIGARLGLTARTVHGHLQDASKRLGIHGRTALAAWWHEHGRESRGTKPGHDHF
ncbi:MAG: response regulator transcription factor [Armatimonadetes bacterium]|nr:response regulator transcription factor [Armatimonadota bacterium]